MRTLKILYFGTVCDVKSYNQLLDGCEYKPSIASVVFESSLLEGFKKNNVDVEIHSFPMVPVFPKSHAVCFGGNKEILSCGYNNHWLYTINLPIIKQWSRRRDARRVIRNWIKTNKSEGVILTYSIPPFLVRDIIKYGKKYSVKKMAIVPDLLKNMYINQPKKNAITFLKQLYIKAAQRFQDKYDGYIFLTEMMSAVVAPTKPYMVMEGIANLDDTFPQPIEKANPRAIMYAGRIHEKYGVLNLVDAFEQIGDSNIELWLFGSGTAEEEIRKREAINSRIKYFGNVSRETVLEYERKATLLVNPRSTKDEFTFYSFPSKNIEYMCSGTPFLTTRLKGIPQEYYDYIFSVEDNDTMLLAKAIQDILNYPEDVLAQKGQDAFHFIKEQKNAAVQSKRIIDFIECIIGN